LKVFARRDDFDGSPAFSSVCIRVHLWPKESCLRHSRAVGPAFQAAAGLRHGVDAGWKVGGRLKAGPHFAPDATARRPHESYDGRTMNRADLYLKVELDLDDLEKPERIAAEICRLLRKVYGVRQVEVSSIVERER
jgi:hypothetical protein